MHCHAYDALSLDILLQDRPDSLYPQSAQAVSLVLPAPVESPVLAELVEPAVLVALAGVVHDDLLHGVHGP